MTFRFPTTAEAHAANLADGRALAAVDLVVPDWPGLPAAYHLTPGEAVRLLEAAGVRPIVPWRYRRGSGGRFVALPRA